MLRALGLSSFIWSLLVVFLAICGRLVNTEACTKLHGCRLSGFRVKAARRVGSRCTYLAWPSISSPVPSHAAPTVMTTGPTRYQVRVPAVLRGCPPASGRGWLAGLRDTWGRERSGEGSACAGLCEPNPRAEAVPAGRGGLPAHTCKGSWNPGELPGTGGSGLDKPPTDSRPGMGGDPPSRLRRGGDQQGGARTEPSAGDT